VPSGLNLVFRDVEGEVVKWFAVVRPCINKRQSGITSCDGELMGLLFKDAQTQQLVVKRLHRRQRGP
jgi:hypothetical protein